MIGKINRYKNIKYIKKQPKKRQIKIKQRKIIKNRCLKIINYFCISDNLICYKITKFFIV